jgi:hypothetical protein
MKKWFLGMLFCIMSVTANAQVSAPAFPADDANFRALVWALLGGERVTLYPAALSPNLPFTIPTPEGSKLIGSRDFSDGFMQVFFEVPLESRAAIAFYRQRLSGADWSNPNTSQQSNPFGFLFTNTSVNSAPQMDDFFISNLCHRPSGFSLDVSPSSESRGNRSNISFYVFRSQCNRQEPVRFSATPAPILTAPDNAQVVGLRSSQSDLISTSNAVMRTNLDTESLLSYYEKQWEAKSWKKLSSHTTKTARWSLWTLEQGERVYLGMMYANPMPGQIGVQQVSMFVGNLF